MKHIFSQTAEYSIKNAACSDLITQLPDAIRKHTDWDYLCEKTDSGFFLKPTFHNMPYINSFVPEISVVISPGDAQTILYMKGQPVKLIRNFMKFWFSSLLIMETFLLAIVAFSEPDGLFPIFTPFVMCTFGYFLCKIATKTTFESVVKAIQKEYS